MITKEPKASRNPSVLSITKGLLFLPLAGHVLFHHIHSASKNIFNSLISLVGKHRPPIPALYIRNVALQMLRESGVI